MIKREFGIVSVTIIFILSLYRIGHCIEQHVPSFPPDKEVRSCIQCADGYAYLSEDMTLSQCRAVASANAKKQALESVKTYMQTKTKVKNFKLEYDIIWSEAEGAIKILEQKDHGVEDNTRYHVWVKAEVSFDLKQKKTQENPQEEIIMDEDAPLTVKVWTDQKKYKTGEKIMVFVQGNRDFYARIVDITPLGDIIQLLPNDVRRLNFFQAGQVYRIPDKEDSFDLAVTPPFGEDRIMVYASCSPLGEVNTRSIGSGLRGFSGTEQDLAAQCRGISIQANAPDLFGGAEFYEASWSLVTGE